MALFADIKGSMELIEDLDPEEARAIVDPALKLMMLAVQRYGGYVPSMFSGPDVSARRIWLWSDSLPKRLLRPLQALRHIGRRI